LWRCPGGNVPPGLWLALVLLIAVAGFGLPWAVPPLHVGALLAGAAEAENDAFEIERNVAVPMRDGVILRMDVLRPRRPGRFPTLVYRTPYDKEDALHTYSIFRKAVQRGYAVVVQDVRGRYASDGAFRPYENEGRDGYDTIEWAARQPWCDGSVGTFGLSYPGAVQWLAAVESPPHLKAMIPAMTFSTPRQFFYFSGVFDLSWIPWILTDIAPDIRHRNHLSGPLTDEAAEKEWESNSARLYSFLPLAGLPDLRNVSPFYYDWLAHPPEDKFWDFAELRGKYSRVKAAVLNLSGWYDEAYGPMGAADNFNGLIVARRGQKDAPTRLLIGPWEHGVEETGESKAGEREFSPAAKIDYDETVLRWMDCYLRGLANGITAEPPVGYFVMGANEWRTADQWPPPARQVPLYLAAGANAQGGGELRWESPEISAASMEFTSDPLHPVTDPHGDAYGSHDYRALVGAPGVLTYDSAALESDFEVTGPITAVIYISADAPDMDLWVRLLDVAPDGTAWNLMSPGADVQRASYRDAGDWNPGASRRLLTVNRVYEIRLTRLITSNVFLKGHRLRVQISGALFPHLSRNLQTGERAAWSARSRTAHIQVWSDASHPSHLLLPHPSVFE
jgi:putative CocE/NonD family hydrolase